jgi:hypothetical protein
MRTYKLGGYIPIFSLAIHTLEILIEKRQRNGMQMQKQCVINLPCHNEPF